MNKKEFLKIISAVVEIFGKDLSTMAIDLYYKTLKNYSEKEIREAFNQVVRTHKYHTMPKPAEIIEKIEGKQEDKGMLAWNQVIKAIRKHGYYDTVVFADKTIHKVIEHLGGWMWLCEQTKDDLKFIAKDFYRLYPLLAREKSTAPQKMIGYMEKNNSFNNFKDNIPEPKMVGFEEKQIENKLNKGGRNG